MTEDNGQAADIPPHIGEAWTDQSVVSAVASPYRARRSVRELTVVDTQSLAAWRRESPRHRPHVLDRNVGFDAVSPVERDSDCIAPVEQYRP